MQEYRHLSTSCLPLVHQHTRHFDNSLFAITLFIQKPEVVRVFDYVRDIRDAVADDMNYEAVEKTLLLQSV